ncbi:XRE family transcriptional regulator [Romboutsia weinsteinii]|uniref:XRE family transcriptional regulator n=1 Tax=Romboutsia weinsteinii TaxID=2020949 RepID=A0A371J3Z1_9FIRM|nr:helix-turn-helix transcriptional regulator [Romboutsia weinsteinii]RDY27433.1 XRE family transcriptional regulator [Romboutsia weinsteinii]
MKSVGERIKTSRKYLNLTKRELAQRVNITELTLSRYESGEREPKVGVLGELSKVLNVSCDYLMGFTDIRNYDTDTGKAKDEKDIQCILEDMLRKEGLMLYGKPLSKQALAKILAAIRVGITIANE